MSKVVLYDNPAKDGRNCYSMYVWRARLVLNYKQIPYETQYVEISQLPETFKPLGISPNPPPDPPGSYGPAYTVPVVFLPSTSQYVMDSLNIAMALEDLYPTMPLQPSHAIVPHVESLITQLGWALSSHMLYGCVHRLINTPSTTWYTSDRERLLGGMSVDEYYEKCGGEDSWENAKGPLKEIVGLLKEEDGGPFLLGKDVSYADFMLVGFFQGCRRLGLLERILQLDGTGAVKALLDASHSWSERDGK